MQPSDAVSANHRTLVGALDGPGNAFNAVRLIAAGLVLVSHSFFIIGGGNRAEPMSWSAFDLGATAVNIFFVLSGMMISRSLDLNPDIVRYVRARLLRIYPGLLFASIITALLIGPLGSDAPSWNYFADEATWLYPLQVAYDFAGASLPQFGHGEHETNASLWTIKFELLAYAACFVLAMLGLTQNRVLWTAMGLGSGMLVASGIGASVEGASAIESLFRFSFAFSLGAVAYQLRYRLRLNVPLGIGLALISTLLGKSGVSSMLCIATVGYAALSLGGLRVPPVLAWTAQTDISFGLYLFGWPIQQALMHWFSWSPAWIGLHIVLSLAFTLPLAWLSWMLIEKPALALK